MQRYVSDGAKVHFEFIGNFYEGGDIGCECLQVKDEPSNTCSDNRSCFPWVLMLFNIQVKPGAFSCVFLLAILQKI